MGTPFLAEIRVISFDFPPRGWAFCNGQQLPINQNQPLFSILGTTYGGNGVTTFALPNLQGRMPIHSGNGFAVGDTGGETSHVLTLNELATHTHQAHAQSAASVPGTSPAGAVWAPSPAPMYSPTVTGAMASGTLSSVGGGQAHDNQSPYFVLNFIIALQGVFPSRN